MFVSTYWAKYVDKFIGIWDYEADLVRKKTKPMSGFCRRAGLLDLMVTGPIFPLLQQSFKRLDFLVAPLAS